MTKYAVCNEWVSVAFDAIKKSEIKSKYENNKEALQLLSKPRENKTPYKIKWGYLFHPNNENEEAWIKDNVDIVTGFGFIVFFTEEYGILLAFEGARYDFAEAHWMPLFEVMKVKCKVR